MKVIIQVVNFEDNTIKPDIEFDLPFDIQFPEELIEKIGKRRVTSMVAVLMPEGGALARE